MTLSQTICSSLTCALFLAPPLAAADSISLEDAQTFSNAATLCAQSGDARCAFENAKMALASEAYLEERRKEDALAHLPEWDRFVAYAFDAANAAEPHERRRIAETALDRIARFADVPPQTTGLHLLRAEACLAQADTSCLADSVAELPYEAGWYVRHSDEAPTAEEISDRLATLRNATP
ncbi:hypothetical protein AADZ90_017295 [Aestuariibius sp. 2305UL40-4]|uniref:hypothetical protein n=1 Tax=Aestuariibius violaceus TaxID=3234132 RepID=UPI00348F5266